MEPEKPPVDGNLVVISLCFERQCGYGYGYTENLSLSLTDLENVVYEEEVLKLATLK